MDVRWKIELLGGLQASHEGPAAKPAVRTLTRFRTRKTGALLAYLAYYLQRAHPRDVLIEVLWPEYTPQAGRNNLSRELSWLRDQLEPPGVPTGAVLEANRATVRLNAEVVTSDVGAFESALRSTEHAGTSPERTALLAQAVELYHGPLLTGYYEEWVLGEQERLAEAYFQALRRLLVNLEEAGELDRALQYARRGVSVDRLREEAHYELVRLLAATGQPAAALRQFWTLERLLEQELGTSPTEATRALVSQIQRLSSLPRPAALPTVRAPVRRSPATSGDTSATVSPEQAEGDNRVVTVLFAGVSHPAGLPPDLHPEEAVVRVNRLLEAMVDGVLQYGGRVDRFLGDRVLGVFGVPHAHEDDPERAIRAALEVGKAVRQMGLDIRAGINTGSVYAGIVGPDRHQELTVVGPAVDRAAWLQEQAGPGQILVGDLTYRLTRRAIMFAPVSLPAGGKADAPRHAGPTRAVDRGTSVPVAAQAVLGALPRPTKTRGVEGLRAELVGRDKELAQLREALTLVRQGRGQIVSLIGEAGLGKSRLVAELKLDRAGGETSGSPPDPVLLWLEGRCLELGMATGYSLFVDLFHGYFSWPSGMDEAGRVRQLTACVDAMVDRGALSTERAKEIGALLANLLSLRVGNEWDIRLRNAPPEQIRHQTLLALQEVFIAFSQRQPIALVFEDLHWADSLSLDVISLLIEALPRAPLLLLCVYRPEREQNCWHLGTIASRKCPDRYTELMLRELTPRQSRRLVQSLLGATHSPAVVEEKLLATCHGNPFFVEEVVHSLIDAGMLYRERDVWQAREGLEALAVPESLQGLILSRVDRLDRATRSVLEKASVIGRLFRRPLLEQMTPPEMGLGQALVELAQRGLIYPERVVPEEEYSFRHILTQETIYRSLLRRRRATLHQQVGEALEALYPERLEEYHEPLAYHYERSAADEKAIEYLLKAGEKARRAYLNDVAIGYFQRALERLEAGGAEGPREARQEWRLAALKGLGQIYHGMGKEAEAEEMFRQTIAVGREIGLAPRELVRLYAWLGDVLWWRNQYDEIIRLGEEGSALLGEETQSVEAALINSTAAVGYLNRGNTPKWRELTYRNAQFLQQLPYSEELLLPYVHVILVYAFGAKDVEEALRWLRALERQAEQHHDLRAQGQVQRYLGADILASQGDLCGAVSHCQRAVELFARIGDEKHQSLCLQGMGRALLALGDLQQAEEQTERGLDIAERVGSKDSIAALYDQIGTIWRCQGFEERAAAAFRKALALGRAMGDDEIDAARSLARVYLAQGNSDAAAQQFREAAVLARRSPARLAAALSGLEEVYEDPERFYGFWRCLAAEHLEIADLPLTQWILEPAAPLAILPAHTREEFAESLSREWTWHDPFNDSSFTVRRGLEIHAANGRDLGEMNLSAPRLLRPVSGDAAVQTVCLPASEEKPAIGGLLIWKDNENFLRLDRGTRGAHEVSFAGRVGDEDRIFGRGRLVTDRIFLRLERREGRVTALCSPDGQNWLAVGCVEFAVEDPIEAGLHAIGAIDRVIYHGAYPAGTAIRFESFELAV